MLATSHLQFGFKQNMSSTHCTYVMTDTTTHCTYVMMETISHCNANGSKVYAFMLDASKAPDIEKSGSFLDYF